jgi:predicted porin
MLSKSTLRQSRAGLIIVAISGFSAFNLAQAATVYEGDGFKYDLKGDWQVQLRQKVGKDKKLDMEFDDLELKNRATYSLNDTLSAFGQLDYSFDKEANKGSADDADGGRLEEAYLGLAFKNIALRFGKQNYSSDEFSVEKAYETVVADDIFDLKGDAGDDVIRVDATFGNVFVSASTDLKAEGNPDSDENQSTDLFVSTSIADLTLNAAYQRYKALGADAVSSWGVGAVYDAGFATFGADYGIMKNTAKVYNLVSTFAITSAVNAAIGLQNIDDNGSGINDVTGWYANATYRFPTQKNVSLFAEIGDTDEDGSSLGYLAGMQLKF